MIHVLVELDKDCIYTLLAIGHAQSGTTDSASCAVVSSVLRAFAMALERFGISCEGSAERPGHFFIRVSEKKNMSLGEISFMVLEQLRFVEQSYPDEFQLELKEY